MPRSNPTPEELQRGTAQILDTLTTALRQLERLHEELVEAGKLVGLDWPRIAEATGKPSKDAARKAHKRAGGGPAR